jgi:hypothetical protein
VGWKEARLSLVHTPGSVTPVFGATVGPPDQIGETLLRTAVQRRIVSASSESEHKAPPSAVWLGQEIANQRPVHMKRVLRESAILAQVIQVSLHELFRSLLAKRPFRVSRCAKMSEKSFNVGIEQPQWDAVFQCICRHVISPCLA